MTGRSGHRSRNEENEEEEEERRRWKKKKDPSPGEKIPHG
jgi:hypothetical protein